MQSQPSQVREWRPVHTDSRFGPQAKLGEMSWERGLSVVGEVHRIGALRFLAERGFSGAESAAIAVWVATQVVPPGTP